MNFKFLILNLSLTALLLAFPGSRPALAGNPTPSPTVDKPAASVTVIPNPVRGKKVTFRVMADRPVKVRIRVYNRFLDTVVEFEKDGEKLFDVLWALKKVPEGIYYYQAQVTDQKTGVLVSIPVQKFVILKETNPSPR